MEPAELRDRAEAVYGAESWFLAAVQEAGLLTTAEVGKFKAYLLAAIRSGPRGSIASVSAALGESAATVRSWRRRCPGFADAGDLALHGPFQWAADLLEGMEPGDPRREDVWRTVMNRWPLPRGLRTAQNEGNRRALAHPDEARAVWTELTEMVGVDEPYQPVSSEDFLTPAEELELYAIVDHLHTERERTRS